MKEKTTRINKVLPSSNEEIIEPMPKGGVRNMIQFRLKGSIDYIQLTKRYNQSSKASFLKIKFRKKS